MARSAEQGGTILKYRFFSVPAAMPEEAEEAVNQFCIEHRVVSVERELVQNGDGSYWALCICYLDKQGGPLSTRRGRVDYREVLNDKEFTLFAKLRQLRKTLAEREGTTLYALFTNEQLATMVQKQVTSMAALAEIDGVGPARLEKYGEAFVKLLREQQLDGVDRTSPANGEAPPR